MQRSSKVETSRIKTSTEFPKTVVFLRATKQMSELGGSKTILPKSCCGVDVVMGLVAVSQRMVTEFVYEMRHQIFLSISTVVIPLLKLVKIPRDSPASAGQVTATVRLFPSPYQQTALCKPFQSIKAEIRKLESPCKDYEV